MRFTFSLGQIVNDRITLIQNLHGNEMGELCSMNDIFLSGGGGEKYNLYWGGC
jgi:hypothetical protein